MKFIAAALFATSAVAMPTERPFEGQRLVRIKTSEIDVLNELADKNGLDVWSVDRLKRTMDVIYDDSLAAYEHEVVVPDVQAHFDELFKDPSFLCEKGVDGCIGEVNVTTTSVRGQKRDPYYESYQRLDTIFAKLDTLAASTSTQANVEAFELNSKSYEGRDIRGIKITGSGGFNTGKGIAVYNCGIHAREWLPVSFCVYLMDELSTLYGVDPEVTQVLDMFEVHTIPVLNPDGYEWSQTVSNNWRLSRKPNAGSNAIGTDLNRNFEYGWGGGGSSGVPGSCTYRGAAPLDNPETKAIADYWAAVRPLVIMDIHAYGYMWLQPFGTQPTSACRTDPRACGVEDEQDYQDQTTCAAASVEAIRAIDGTNFRAGPITYVIYQASGGTCDHAYGVADVKYAYTPEVRGSSFQPPTSQLGPSNLELFAGTMAQLSCAGFIDLGGPAPPTPPPTPPVPMCDNNSCVYAFDVDCDDGGSGADYSLCAYGSDCFDCCSKVPSRAECTL